MENKSGAGQKKLILTTLQWWFSASALLSMVIVPLVVGVFYILELAYRIFNQPAQYSVLYGLMIGIVLSLLAGYWYAGMAKRRVE